MKPRSRLAVSPLPPSQRGGAAGATGGGGAGCAGRVRGWGFVASQPQQEQRNRRRRPWRCGSRCFQDPGRVNDQRGHSHAHEECGGPVSPKPQVIHALTSHDANIDSSNTAADPRTIGAGMLQGRRIPEPQPRPVHRHASRRCLIKREIAVVPSTSLVVGHGGNC